MARSASWDESAPAGTTAANTLDTIIQNFKRDVRERMDDVVGDFSDDAVDPLRIKVHVDSSEPSSPNLGELFYNSSNDGFYIYDGSSFVLLSGGSSAIVNTGTLSNRPAAGTAGSGALYWAIDTDTLYIVESSEWVAVGGGGGTLSTYQAYSYNDGNGVGNKVSLNTPSTRIFVVSVTATTSAAGEVEVDLGEFDDIAKTDVYTNVIATNATGYAGAGSIAHIIQKSISGEVITFVCLDETGATVNSTAVVFGLWIPASAAS